MTIWVRWGIVGLTILAAGAGQARGAIIGPDAFGYRATSDIPFSFEDISTTGTRVLADVDDDSVAAALGFQFGFYGSVYNSLFISSNGLLAFGGPESQFTNVNLSIASPDDDRPVIAVLWDDWIFSSNFDASPDAAYYQTLGSPGEQRFVVQWNQARSLGEDKLYTFQAVLFEGSNDILFSYQSVEPGGSRSAGASATVGIQDTDGQNNGNYLQWSYNQAVISDGLSILFTTQAPVSPVPEPSSFLIFAVALSAIVVRSRYRNRSGKSATFTA
jgi:hypothetical protein